MTAGKPYYIEVWHKERNSDDHLSVLWQWEDEEKPTPVPPDVLRPYQLHHDDRNDNGLPDSWEAKTGLARIPNVHAWQDSDGDGILNIHEYQAGTDPLDGGKTHGFLRWEIWFGIPGGEVADLTASPRFARPADLALLLPGSSTPVMTASNFGSRLSGLIVPEDDGFYQFAITADDAGELWLSTDDDPVNRRLIAFCDTWRAADRWDAVDAQLSEPIHLSAGTAYYLEVLHKDHHAPGRLDIGWRPAESENPIVPIPARLLRSPGDTPEARTRGHLCDDWLASHASRHPDGPDTALSALTPYGNPSGDRIPNWIKARDNLDPFTRHERPGGLTREWWFHSPGGSLDAARRAGHLLRRPSMITHTDGSRAEENTTDHFISRLRGTLTIPETATYRFWIAGDDHCELWLSDNDRKFHKHLIAHVGPAEFENPDAPAWTDPLDWDARPTQRSREFTLTEGTRRFIEILHKDGNGDDHVAVAWQIKRPGQSHWGPRELIPAEFLHGYAGDPDDLDDDYLPDSWEKKYGLDPTDNGRRDPRQGEYGDYDGDGLTNREEFLLGTDPTNPDTDGDGVSDYDEIHIYRSNPLVKDVSPPVENHRFQLATGNFHHTSPWVLSSDGTLTSGQRRGTIQFEFDLAEPGIHTLTLTAGASGNATYIPPVPVSVNINGARLGFEQFPADTATRTWLTPWLPAGRHHVVVENHNVRAGIGLSIHALVLSRFEGHDSNGHGIPDWLTHFLSDRNNLDADPETASISPWFAEGACRTPQSVTITTRTGETKAFDNLAGRWHADIPLPDDGTPITIDIHYEHGAVTQTREIRWLPTNLATVPPVNHLRLGDSIRATAHHHTPRENATFTLRHLDNTWEKHPVDAPITITFDQPGIHTVSASLDDGTLVTTTFHVHHADLGEPISIASGTSRPWKPAVANVPVEITVDDGWHMAPNHDEETEGSPLDFIVWNVTEAPGTYTIVARLPHNGPIITTGSIHSFSIASASHTRDSHVIGTLPDGTRVVQLSYIIDGPIPDDLSIWIRLYVTDAVFANGLTWLQLTAADFDENGVATFNVYKAPGEGTAYVCHWILPYADLEDVLSLRPVD